MGPSIEGPQSFVVGPGVELSGVTVGSGLDDDRVSFEADAVYIDLAGLSAPTGAIVSIDFRVGGF